jgi:hypothetical protein
MSSIDLEKSTIAYDRRNHKGEWRLAPGSQTQASMIDIMGLSFIPVYKVIGLFTFFVSLVLMV